MPVNYGSTLVKAGAPTDGVFQVETLTVVGTITTAGNASVIVTAAGMTGSPITLTPAVALNDTASLIAGKVRTALAANGVIAAFLTISGATDKVIGTRTMAAANDATLDISIADGTCVGITPASSANTTAGVHGDYRGVPAGSQLVDTTNRVIYENSGNQYRSAWTEIVPS